MRSRYSVVVPEPAPAKAPSGGIKFNEAKLQALNTAVQSGFQHLRTLNRAAIEMGGDIHLLRRRVEAKASGVREDRLTREDRHSGETLEQLQQQLGKLERKKAQINSLYDEAQRAQEARSRLLEESLRVLRELGVEVDFAVTSSTFRDQVFDGRISDTIINLNFPNRGA